MVVKGSRSTIDYNSQSLIKVGDETGATINTLVYSLDNYDIFLGMPYLTAHSAIIDCGNATIIFPKNAVTFTYKEANNNRFSAKTNSNTPDFISELPEVFPTKKIPELRPLRKMNHHIKSSKQDRHQVRKCSQSQRQCYRHTDKLSGAGKQNKSSTFPKLITVSMGSPSSNPMAKLDY